MRTVVLGDSAVGFCPTVERAVKLLIAAAKAARKMGGSVVYRNAPKQCLPLIRSFLAQGLPLVEYSEGMELTKCVWYVSPYGGGVPPEWFKGPVFDTTCGVIQTQQKVATKAVERGHKVVFCGEHTHPEATNLVKRLQDKVIIVEESADLGSVDLGEGGVTVLQQSTYPTRIVNAITERLSQMVADVDYRMQPCKMVCKRIAAAAALGRTCQAVIIIGREESHHAREMRRLALEDGCELVFIVSSPEEAAALELPDGITVGLLSTTSTPMELVEAIATALRGSGE
jgi:4-hydroxy-3-methylbut-2-enyl diphosphate reductase